MRLYHVPKSCSQRVLWTLEEIGQPYDITFLGDRASRVADQEHMKRHPMGRVPVLEIDGTNIFESAGLCLFLADKFPEAGLLPESGTVERGLAFQWSLFAYTELQARMVQVRAAQSPEAAEAPKAALDEAIAVVASALEGHDYLVGDSFSVADVLIASILGSIRRLGVADLPATLTAYVDRMDQRPAKQRSDAMAPEAASVS